MPAAISGSKIALAIAVIAAFIAETTTSGVNSGLGHEIVTDLTALQTARAYAAAAVLGVFALLCFYILALTERRLTPWSHRGDDGVSRLAWSERRVAPLSDRTTGENR